MTKNLAFLIALLVGSAAWSSDKTVKDLAIAAFTKAQSLSTPADIAEQIAVLAQNGYTKKGDTDALVLTQSCGFSGCDYLFLVTTYYFTQKADLAARPLAAIVGVADYSGETSIRRIVTSSDLERLISERTN